MPTLLIEKNLGGHGFAVDPKRCIRCGECVRDCPVNILAIGSEPPSVVIGREHDCIGCQHCLAVCPTGAVSVRGLVPENSLELTGAFPSPAHLDTLLKGRRSIRRYREEDVDRETIRRLIQSAGHAPSGRNCRHVRFTVIPGRAEMDRFRDRAFSCIAGALHDNRFGGDTSFWQPVADGWYRFGADIIFRWAPHLLITSVPKADAAPLQDGMIALSYFELLAQTSGLGTLWSGMAANLLEQFAELRGLLEIPEDHVIGYAMCFGFPAINYQRTVQYPETVIHWGELS